MLSWPDATYIGFGLALLGLAFRSRRAVMRAAAPLFEAAVLFWLYALWQFAGSFTVAGSDGGLSRGWWIWHLERDLFLPSETAVQKVFLPYPVLIHGCDFYYDILHFPVLIACLIWVFWRHRTDYPRIQTILVAFTAASLLVQLIPVAPPRLLAGTGLVDTAYRYGESVYTWGNGALEADQYSAMPSVHVGWAIIVAIAIITVSPRSTGGYRSRWRWLAVGYPVMTTLVVVVTANHFWLDGIVAGFLVVLAILVERGLSAVRRRPGRPGLRLFGDKRLCDHDAHDEHEREIRDRDRAGAGT